MVLNLKHFIFVEKKETTENTCAKADSAGKGDTQLPAVTAQQNSGQDCVVASEGDKTQSMEVNSDNSESNAEVASEKSQGNSNSVQTEAKRKTDEDDEDPELTKYVTTVKTKHVPISVFHRHKVCVECTIKECFSRFLFRTFMVNKQCIFTC